MQEFLAAYSLFESIFGNYDKIGPNLVPVDLYVTNPSIINQLGEKIKKFYFGNANNLTLDGMRRVSKIG